MGRVVPKACPEKSPQGQSLAHRSLSNECKGCATARGGRHAAAALLASPCRAGHDAARRQGWKRVLRTGSQQQRMPQATKTRTSSLTGTRVRPSQQSHCPLGTAATLSYLNSHQTRGHMTETKPTRWCSTQEWPPRCAPTCTGTALLQAAQSQERAETQPRPIKSTAGCPKQSECTPPTASVPSLLPPRGQILVKGNHAAHSSPRLSLALAALAGGSSLAGACCCLAGGSCCLLGRGAPLLLGRRLVVAAATRRRAGGGGRCCGRALGAAGRQNARAGGASGATAGCTATPRAPKPQPAHRVSTTRAARPAPRTWRWPRTPPSCAPC
jgi:hypothetical protein